MSVAGIGKDTLFTGFQGAALITDCRTMWTIGAGYEYLSSVTSGSMMPYINTSVRLAPNLLISGDIPTP
jgi:hypothetical protein